MQARLWRNFDLILLVTTLVLIIFGVAMVQSATLRYGANFPSLDALATKQAIFAVIGLGAMFVMARVDYRFLETFTLPLYLLILALLGAIFALGYVSGGAQRWFDLGFTNLQPSELAKMGVVLTLAKLLADREAKINSPLNVAIASACVIVPLVLIYLQPDMGTSLVVGAIWLGMMYAIGLKWFYWVGGLVFSIPAGFVAWNYVLHDYMKDRFLIFLNPESDPLGQGYNILQARISIGSGGWFGRGYGSGIQSQLHYLRVPHTDFIFSVISEEFGFFGAVFLCLLLMIVVWRHFKIAETAADTYGKLIAVGLGSWLLFQVFVNIGMNLGMMPVTGIPLPLISYGGSSLLTILICEGIVQSVAMRHTKSLF